MNQATSTKQTETWLTQRRIAWAGAAAVAGCAAACSLPALLIAAGGGAAATSIAGLFGAGKELLVGGLAFAAALGVMVVRSRARATARPSSPVPSEALPIACDPSVFTQEERRTHAERAKDLLIRRPLERRLIENGLELHYAGTKGLFVSLAEWVAAEHRCCSWARFSLELEPSAAGSSGEIRVRMTGGPEGRKLLAEAIRQLEESGPVVQDFVRGDRTLTAQSTAARPRPCGC
jgi:hypothetical protein